MSNLHRIRTMCLNEKRQKPPDDRHFHNFDYFRSSIGLTVHDLYTHTHTHTHERPAHTWPTH